MAEKGAVKAVEAVRHMKGAAEPPDGRRRRRVWPHVPLVAGLSTLIAALHGVYGMQQYYGIRLGGYDLLIFDQAIRAYSRFQAPISHFKDVTDGPVQVRANFHHTFTILGDHFSPILALLAPLYWIWNNIQILLIAQAALFGLAVPFVWVFARRALEPLGVRAWAPYCVAFAFGVSWMLQDATSVGFHEVAFIVPVMAAMIERGQAASLGRGRWWHVVVAAVLLLLCKEEMGYVVAMYGVVLFVVHRKRLLGLVLFVVGIVEVQLIIDVWLPAFGAKNNYYWYYGQLGPNMPQALLKILTDPLYAGHIAITPQVKWQVMLALLWPFAFTALASPLVLLAVPLLAERMFSSKSTQWGFGQHYNSMLAPVIVLAAVDGAARVLPWLGRLIAGKRFSSRLLRNGGLGRLLIGAWALTLAGIGVSYLFTGDIYSEFEAHQWRRSHFEKAELHAISMIPRGENVTVDADDNAATYLADRNVTLFSQQPQQAHHTEWILVQTSLLRWPFPDIQAQRASIRYVSHHGYHVVYSYHHWVLLKSDTLPKAP